MVRQDDGRPEPIESYRPILGDAPLDELTTLASHLKGARVAHINATAEGGGVAEILGSLIPLYRDAGIDASWLVLQGSEPFFHVTKRLHNALQGAKDSFTPDDWDVYMEWNRLNARTFTERYDVVFLHDPQTAAMAQFASEAATHWVWRCHIDTSTPDQSAWRAIGALVSDFDAAVFSTPDFVGPDDRLPRVAIIPPAINPHAPKNRTWARAEAVKTVAHYGVDPRRPFITQVSRFDPWKDPEGVISCFLGLKERHPSLQLVLLGNFADDDPEGVTIYSQVLKAAQQLPDIHIITGLTDLVSPLQSLSRVVLQKSLREGFGLTVTEALWKGTPVVAGNVGGIRLQIGGGVGGFLVDSIEECTEKVNYLLEHEEERLALGEAGREHVRSHFLLPHLLLDELQLVHELVNGAPPPTDWTRAEEALARLARGRTNGVAAALSPAATRG